MTRSNGSSSGDLVISHLHLRRMIGWLGIFFPFVLIFSSRICQEVPVPLQTSISAYYHTCIQDVFVSVLAAIGVFLIAYRGYSNELDNSLTNLCGFFAIGVALFPVDQGNFPTWTGRLHLAFACGFFLVLIVLCFHVFTKGKGTADRKKLSGWRIRQFLWKLTNLDLDLTNRRGKKLRNMTYRLAGSAMAICLISIVGIFIFDNSCGSSLVFWLESAALEAFGIAWIIKGKAIRSLLID